MAKVDDRAKRIEWLEHVCTDLHEAGQRAALHGAIIGVAEPRPTLPIFFG